MRGEETKRRFLHRMKKLPQVFSFMNEYEINGLRWHGVSYSDYDTLSIHREGDVIIEVRHCYSEDGFSWDWRFTTLPEYSAKAAVSASASRDLKKTR